MYDMRLVLLRGAVDGRLVRHVRGLSRCALGREGITWCCITGLCGFGARRDLIWHDA